MSHLEDLRRDELEAAKREDWKKLSEIDLPQRQSERNEESYRLFKSAGVSAEGLKAFKTALDSLQTKAEILHRKALRNSGGV